MISKSHYYAYNKSCLHEDRPHDQCVPGWMERRVCGHVHALGRRCVTCEVFDFTSDGAKCVLCIIVMYNLKYVCHRNESIVCKAP